MIKVLLYFRQDCHLCEVAQTDLNELQGKYPHSLILIDIDSNKDLQRAYGFDVPVIEIGPYRIKPPYTKQELEMTLAAAIDRKKQIEDIGDQQFAMKVAQNQRWTFVDSFTYWISKHYLFLFNFFVMIYVALPFLAPVFMKNGYVTPAKLIYKTYGFVCHQLSYRSFFLFGEQLVYPRQAAGLKNIFTYQEMTGYSEDNSSKSILTASEFIGNEVMGYKVALCERDIATYLSILFFGLLYGMVGRRLPPLHWFFWIFLGLVPIGLDGLSQLISQPPFNLFPYRESTPFLRVLTGFLFGFTTAWFGYPLVELTMDDSRKLLAARYIRLKKIED
jgi:uncharacterized membrane protein